MTPTQVGDLVRLLTATIQGGVMVAWIYILFKTKTLEGIRLRRWTIASIAGVFLLFTYLTIESVVRRAGQPPSTSLSIVLLYLVLVISLTVFVFRDLRREYEHRNSAGGDSAGGRGGTGGPGGPGGTGPGGGTGGVGGKGGAGGKGSGDEPGQPGEPGKPGKGGGDNHV